MRGFGPSHRRNRIFTLIFSIPMLAIVGLVVCVIYLTPHVVTAVEGAVDRFDFMIGYEVGEP